MDKEINEDARTKQDLLYECSSLESRLSDEIVKNEHLEQQCKKQKEVIDRKKYLLIEQGAELKELYSEIDKLQGRIDKAIEYLEEPNRDSFDYSKAELLDILSEVSE